MRLRAAITVGLAALFVALCAPFLATSSAGAYPVTTCSTLAVSTTNPLPGQSITVTGTNFQASVSVSLVLRPGETPLKTVTTDARGSFSTQVTMPDSTTNGGNFLIVAVTGAVSSTSCPADPFQSLAVQAAAENNGSSSGNGGLSSTGLDIAGLLALAAGLLGAGVLLNRKRAKATSH